MDVHRTSTPSGWVKPCSQNRNVTRIFLSEKVPLAFLINIIQYAGRAETYLLNRRFHFACNVVLDQKRTITRDYLTPRMDLPFVFEIFQYVGLKNVCLINKQFHFLCYELLGQIYLACRRNPAVSAIIDSYDSIYPEGVSSVVKIRFIMKLLSVESVDEIIHILEKVVHPSMEDINHHKVMIAHMLVGEIERLEIENPQEIAFVSAAAFDKWMVDNIAIIAPKFSEGKIFIGQGVRSVPLSFRLLGAHGSLTLEVASGSAFLWDDSQSVCLPCIGKVEFGFSIREHNMQLAEHLKECIIDGPQNLPNYPATAIVVIPPPHLQRLQIADFISFPRGTYPSLVDLVSVVITPVGDEIVESVNDIDMDLESSVFLAPNLEYLSITSYQYLEAFPEGYVFKSLKELHLLECSALTNIDFSQFPNLISFTYDSSTGDSTGLLRVIKGGPLCKIETMTLSGINENPILNVRKFTYLSKLIIEYCDEIRIKHLGDFLLLEQCELVTIDYEEREGSVYYKKELPEEGE